MKTVKDSADPDSMILKAMVRYIFLGIAIYSLYITAKGHNEPGGGFIGGLVAALALVLVNMVLGLDEMKKIVRFDPVRIAAFGLLLSYGSALAPMLMGLDFFQHDLKWSFAGLEIGIPTALLFDLGVFMVVVGVASKLIIAFSSSVQLRSAFLSEEERFYSTPFEEPVEDAAWGDLAPGMVSPVTQKMEAPRRRHLPTHKRRPRRRKK